MRKGKDPDPEPDPYLRLMDPDPVPEAPKTCGSPRLPETSMKLYFQEFGFSSPSYALNISIYFLQEGSRPTLASEKRPVISHSQRFFRVPFVKTGETLNNNPGDPMKVTLSNFLKGQVAR
jgi:hypothetical protein